MKKVILLLLLIFVYAARSQNTVCVNASTLTLPVASFSINATTANNELWYTIQLPAGNYKFSLDNLDSPVSVFAANMYMGACGSLTLVSYDSLDNATDPDLRLNIQNLTGTNDFYLKVKTTTTTVNSLFSIQTATFVPLLGCPGGGPCPVTGTCELVCNGGFEYTWGQPTGISEIGLAYNWADANWAGTADLFSTGGVTWGVQIPCNHAGTQNTLSPSACSPNNFYAGIYSIDYPPGYGILGPYSEYLQTKLTYAMVAGEKYIVSFYISKGDDTDGKLSEMGIWLTNTQIYDGGPAPLPNALYPPAAVYTNTTIINNKGSWNRLVFCYTATGGEEFLTIGRTENSTITQGNILVTGACGNPPIANTPYDMAAFHYIDDVSVVPYEINVAQTVTCATVSFTGSYACINPTVYLTTYSLTWAGGPGVITNTAGLTATAVITGNAVYSLTATGLDSNGPCVYTNTMSVLYTVQQLTITPSAFTVCPNSTVSLVPNGGVGNYTFFPGGGIGTSTVYSPGGPTTYTVQGINLDGCPVSNTITIQTFPNTLTVTASHYTICQGFSSTLTATGGIASYTWNPGALTGNTVNVTPNATTEYTLIGVTPNNCTLSALVTVTVINPPTINILPGNPAIMCINSSITLTATGGVSYTWQPMNVVSPTVNVSPTVTTVYTVVAVNASGCTSTITPKVEVAPLPTINCFTLNGVTCPGASAAIGATGANTYTWFPTAQTGATVIVGPNIPTNYTVIGTSTAGCTNSCVVTQSVYPLTANDISLTATPSVICVLPPSVTTLNVLGAAGANYTWMPSGLVGVSMTVNIPGVYTALAQSTNGCIYTKTVMVLGTDANVAASGTTICTNGTVNLLSLVNPSTNVTFSINGTPTVNIVGPLTPGTYTMAFTYTGGIMCTNTASALITILAVPDTPTIVASPTIACINGILTLTATPPSVYGYTWQPGNYVGNPVIFTPTTGMAYTVQTGPPACLKTATLFVDQIAVPCGCMGGCTSTLGGLVGTSPSPNSDYCINNNVTISGAVNFIGSDFKIWPGITITVLPNATLTIKGSHLYSCDWMWQGIIVQNKGHLNIIPNGTVTSFIEDAYVAVDVENWAFSTSATNVLTLDDVTFNRNQIGVRLGWYNIVQTPYPYTIGNCLFTSRDIAFSPLSWPATNTVKNSASGNTSPLQTPRMDNSTYPPAYMKAPLNSDFPSNGMVLDAVARYSTPGPTFYGIKIGESGSNNFNMFDNLYNGITATSSNIKVTNSVFQNGRQYGFVNAGATGIVATSPFNDDSPGVNKIEVIPDAGSLYKNYFYELNTAVDVSGYLSTEISNNEVRSYANDYDDLPFLNMIGQTGIYVNTNRFINLNVNANKLYNIRNNILFNLDDGPWEVGTITGTGRFIGQANFNNNIITKHPTTPVADEYVNIGISLQDIIIAPGYTPTASFGLLSPFFAVTGNTITAAHNGISVSNLQNAPSSINNNIVTMVNEPLTFGTPTQYGIVANQLQNTQILRNNVSGPVSYTNNTKAISTSMNALMAIRCNTTANTLHGLEFNDVQTISMLEDNIMQNQYYGFALDNGAQLTSTVATYVMGSATRPTNNVWLGAWSLPNYKTGTLNGASAVDGKLYIQYGVSSLDPDGSGYTDLTPGLQNYFHTGGLGPVTLLNVNPTSTVAPGCRITGGGGAKMAVADTTDGFVTIATLLEQTSTDSSNFGMVSAEADFINKNLVYRTLATSAELLDSSVTLSNFYSGLQNSQISKLVKIELNFAGDSLALAASKINAFTPVNAVESNYKQFYHIYKSRKVGNYVSTDSIDLLNLANSCPYTEGGVVYQARALYQMIYKTYRNFNDNCPEIAPKNIAMPEKSLRVLLKTELFPNPNTGEYKIRFREIHEKENVEITIFDISGRLVYKESKPLGTQELNMKNDLLNGTYLLKVKFADGSYDVHRLLISK